LCSRIKPEFISHIAATLCRGRQCNRDPYCVLATLGKLAYRVMRSNGCVFLRAGVPDQRTRHRQSLGSHSQRHSKKPLKIAVWDRSGDCPRISSHSATQKAGSKIAVWGPSGDCPRISCFARHETVVFPDVRLVFGVGCAWGISGSGNVMQPTQASPSCKIRPTSAHSAPGSKFNRSDGNSSQRDAGLKKL
jgi:hypothetical protein